MQQADFQRFRAVLAGMAELYQRELSGPLLDAYWLALKSWSLADFESAAAHLMATATFMPRPSDFNQLKKASEPTAGEAWATALANCTCWRGDRPSPGGRIDRAARAIGGYHAIAMADRETALPHIERRFKEAYEELSDVEETREALPEITQVRRLPRANNWTAVGEAMQNLLREDKET